MDDVEILKIKMDTIYDLIEIFSEEQQKVYYKGYEKVTEELYGKYIALREVIEILRDEYVKLMSMRKRIDSVYAKNLANKIFEEIDGETPPRTGEEIVELAEKETYGESTNTIFDKWYLHDFRCFMKDNGTAIYISNKNKKTKKNKKKRR